MDNSGTARASSMLSWVIPERQAGSEKAGPRAPPLAGGHSTLTTIGHGSLKAIQCLFILTQVVGHIPISIDCKEVCTTTRKTDKSPASVPSHNSSSIPLQHVSPQRWPQFSTVLGKRRQ